MAKAGVRRMVERRRRGWVGFAFVMLFWAFNAAMALWMAGVAGVVSKGMVHKTAAYTGGVTSEFSGVWAAGAVVFGGLIMATRGAWEMVDLRD